MSKSKLTEQLEKSIFNIYKDKAFCCPEVTIGWYGNERVDMLTCDFKDIFRCFEVKSSKSDFYSKAKHTFLGHFNYYVMTEELFEQVKQDIPKGIGCYVLPEKGDMYCKLKSSKVATVNTELLKNSLIRSLYREASLYLRDSRDEDIKKLKREIKILVKEKDLIKEYNNKYHYERIDIDRFIRSRLGNDILDELDEYLEKKREKRR